MRLEDANDYIPSRIGGVDEPQAARSDRSERSDM